jgi:hypothetical protein
MHDLENLIEWKNSCYRMNLSSPAPVANEAQVSYIISYSSLDARVNSDGPSGENRKLFNGMTIRDSALN